MQRTRSWLLSISTVGALLVVAGSCTRTPSYVGLGSMAQDAQAPMTVTYNPLTGRPSFIRGRIPTTVFGPPGDTSPAVVQNVMRRYATTFGVDSTGKDLRFLSSRGDTLGMRHMTAQQVLQGVEVYNATYSVHLAPQSDRVVAMSSNLVPNVSVSTTTPALGEDSARALARSGLRHGTVISSRLVVYPGRQRRSSASLAWLVEVTGFARPDTAAWRRGPRPDTVPARREFVVDAARGTILDTLDRLYVARNRETYDAGHGTALPGTLRRNEAAGPVGDADVDSAHTFVGGTYDYYATTHGRDSYDNAGAKLIATVHYSVNFQNAFWDGTQMVYGDGFPVKDVTAHELTHAVTERTANLEYRWQSGALNESFSDIFGAMVDRDDWLMGEDLPVGAIRDLANPGAFGQPGHLSGWVRTCGDNEGVHTNSGIPSKAFVNVATAIGKGDAERIFYRALTVYLHSQATLEDARAAALQAAEDLFGSPSPQLQAVETGFNAVGLDGTAQPPVNNCLPIPNVPDLSLLGFVVLAVLLGVAVMLRARGSGLGVRG